MDYRDRNQRRIIERMFDTSSGDAESKRPPYARPVTPVWLDLGKVYPIEGVRRVVPDGVDLQSRVPAEVLLWEVTTTGHKIAYVRYRYAKGNGYSHAGHWVLAAWIEPRRDMPARPEQRRRPFPR